MEKKGGCNLFTSEVWNIYLKNLKEKKIKEKENDPQTGFGMTFIKKHWLGL